MNIFLTIDTEVWFDYKDIEQNIETAVYGVTSKGEYGLRYIIEKLNQYNLKASFFTEPLFSEIAGKEPLRDIIKLIQTAGHDVQLHIHTEWLGRMKNSIVPGIENGRHIKNFSLDHQEILIKYCQELLRNNGVKNINAFRAGNFGANFNTLQALAKNGILFDTSYNFPYLNSACEIKTPTPLLQPDLLDGVVEIPVSFFRDYPGHYRPFHLTACSFRELRENLFQAWKKGWFSVVIVLHCFELLKRKTHRDENPDLDRIVLNRFEKLCRFLSENQDKIKTMKFSELRLARPQFKHSHILNSQLLYTMHRYFEQGLRIVC